MSPYDFSQRKKDVLSKLDKSSKGDWDEKIIDLCEKINELENYYTTSSCSGRILLIKDKEEKVNDLFVYVSHDAINFNKLKEELDKIKDDSVNFKQESCILHVACKTLEDAEALLNKAREIGWKRSGIISLKNGFICELLSTEKLEFPLVAEGKILVDDGFLKIVIEKANKNLKKSWDKINKLKNLI